MFTFEPCMLTCLVVDFVNVIYARVVASGAGVAESVAQREPLPADRGVVVGFANVSVCFSADDFSHFASAAGAIADGEIVNLLQCSQVLVIESQFCTLIITRDEGFVHAVVSQILVQRRSIAFLHVCGPASAWSRQSRVSTHRPCAHGSRTHVATLDLEASNVGHLHCC